ncbi:MAG: hypothetical protein NTZ56_05150 [Acidobacteria bacterium]|nr:hypothetical protein [Acidobacteriota bacterium]
MKAIQYTIRGIPEELDRVLRQKARQKKVSLNQVILEDLASVCQVERKKRDLSAIAGRWVEDPGFDAVIAAQRPVNWEMWNADPARHQPPDRPVARRTGNRPARRAS